MKSDKLRRAIGGIDADLIEAADRKILPTNTMTVRHRIPRAALIAAVLAVVFSLSVMAYAIVHANSVRLMEAGPMSGGKQAVDIDEPAVQVIENQSVDYGLSVTNNETTVTLESLMGYSTETESLLYLTLTIMPANRTDLPEDVSEYAFVGEHIVFPFDVSNETPWDIPQQGGSTVAVKNPDGSVSVMLMRFFGGPVEGARMKLSLENFAFSGKAAADAELERQAQERISGIHTNPPTPPLEGVWEFDLGRIHLPPQQSLTLDKSVFEEAGMPLNRLELNSFGGKASMDNTAPSDLDRLRAEYPNELRSLLPDVDWDNINEVEFEALIEQGMASVEEDAYLRLCDMFGWLEPWDYGEPTKLTLEYPDGTNYTVEAPNHIWCDVNKTEIEITILFPAPQPISQATAIIINGIRIPLK